MSIETLLGNVHSFLDTVFLKLVDEKIDISTYELDHVCYRVERQSQYQQLKNELGKLGELLSEEQIGGRPISTFKLTKPIIYKDREIWCVELPSPKEEKFYATGFEHVEFVIDTDFEMFMKAHPNQQFSTRAISKEINPDVSLQYDGFSVKFHQQSLEYVITYLE
ncbi:MAG: putative metalloenzyme YecM [Candidatus Woesearchaeota archaeon]|jgi:predicted metalloenzyme YecM